MKQILAFFVALLILAGLCASRTYDFLLFHSLAELISIVIGCGVFAIAWNARTFLKNHYLVLVGVSSLFVAVLGLAHTLAYEGMNVFHGYDADLPTQLWIAARGLESLSFLIAPFLLQRSIRAEFLVLIYGLVTAALLLLIFVWRAFPACYIEGVGLTPFKRGSEYVISFVLFIAIILLLRKRQFFDARVLRWLVLSLVLSIFSEIAFTFYVGVTSPMNVVGHLLKIISLFLVYKAIIETGLAKPFALLLREEKLVEEHLERLVRERTATLQATTDQLNSLVYTIAHDLRAPLRAQHGFAGFLLEDYGPALGDAGRAWVNKISGAAERMDALVAGLLSYASISADAPSLARVELRPLVEQVKDSMDEVTRQASGTIDSAAVRAAVLADPETLALEVGHLLSNAIKFVPPDRAPRVRLWTEERGDWVRLWVEDNGIGIAPKYHEKIFGVFQRLQHASEYPGIGIGLALVKRGVERLGGRVGLESEPGLGSRFWLELKKAA